MIDEKIIKEYVADMAMYYESVHDSVPAQFEKYLRKAVEKGIELCGPNKEQLAELEKENTELREQCANLEGIKLAQETALSKEYTIEEQSKVKLVEAKKYIKLLLMNCADVYESTGKTIPEIQASARQFLKEVEE